MSGRKVVSVIVFFVAAGFVGVHPLIGGPMPTGREYVNSLGMKFVRIEPGTYRMGQLDTPLPAEIVPSSRVFMAKGEYDEKPVHTVTISKAFYMGVTEVTNFQYELFDPGHKGLRGKKGVSMEDDEAAVFVNCYEARAFCDWLSEKESRRAAPYRLPSEAEWEYACRAGTTSNYHTGAILSDEFRGEWPRSGFHVGRTPGNSWGLYDMHGNVEEWCSDWYGPYRGGRQVDPGGYVSGDFRVTRGGSDGTGEFFLRSANRLGSLPSARNRVIGFRVVIGEAPESELWPEPEVPLHQRDVVSRSRAEVLKGPDPDKPYFDGPRRFVNIPREMAGPVYRSHNHHPAIVECPNGDLLTAWFSTVTEGGREVAQAASRLRRGSDRWDQASLFWYSPDRNGPPVQLCFDGEDTIYHFAAISYARRSDRIFIVRKSKDSGATWSRAHIAIADHSRGRGPAGSTFRMQDGRIAQTCDMKGGVLRFTSDGGLTWSRSTGHVAGIHAGVTQLADGRLIGLGRGGNIDDMMPKSISEDSGETWSYSASEFPPIGGQQRLVLRRLKEGPLFFASFADRGTEITDASGARRMVRGLFAAVSQDNGQTWPWKRLITDDGPGRAVETTAGGIFTMSGRNGEYRGYLRACQGANGLIHLVSSQQHYTFNLKWLQTPAPALRYPPVRVKDVTETFSGPDRFDLDGWADYHSYSGGFNSGVPAGQYRINAIGPVSGLSRIVGEGSFEMDVRISGLDFGSFKPGAGSITILFRDSRLRNFSIGIRHDKISLKVEDKQIRLDPAVSGEPVLLSVVPSSVRLRVVYNENSGRLRIFYGLNGADATIELPQSKGGIYFGQPLSESTAVYLLMSAGSMDLDYYALKAVK